MKENEIIIKVFKILLDNPDLFESGLCGWLKELYLEDIIGLLEYNTTHEYLNNNLPKKYFKCIYLTMLYVYSWEYGVITHRINWINEQIKILENEKN